MFPLNLAEPAAASVKLITLPPRERVEVQLDNPNATLVEEERLVPLNAGVNEVVFGWAVANIGGGMACWLLGPADGRWAVAYRKGSDVSW